MAEGPSIVILRERAGVLVGRRIVRVEGDAPIAKERLLQQRVAAVRSFGKQFLVELGTFSLRIHLLMLGSYCIDRRKDKPIRLGLGFDDGTEINFYSCSAKFVEEPLDEVIDWRRDVMADAWDAALARKSLRALPAGTLVCDALLDQTLFAGVGNVIKNEILFRIRLHPLSTVGALSPAKLRELVVQVRRYTFEFYDWKQADAEGDKLVWQGDTLASHWRVHNKKTCPRCAIPLTKAHLGVLDRRSFYCEKCQKRAGAFDPTSRAGDPVRDETPPPRDRVPRQPGDADPALDRVNAPVAVAVRRVRP